MRRRLILKMIPAGVLTGLPTFAGAARAAGLVPAFRGTPRIAVGGIASECSTYSRIRARMEDLTVLRGQDVFKAPLSLPLQRYETPFLPTLTASAPSSGPVERQTYETLKADYLERLKKLLPLDGVYLMMHGALSVEGMDDAEGDWYEATRAVVGPDCLISAYYDLHGNLSRRAVDTLDAMTAYRTAPHVDRVENMMRATDMLTHCLRYGLRPGIVWASIPALLPGEQSSTEWEPGRRLWADLSEYNRLPGILDVSQLVGYVWADEPRAAASVVTTGTNIEEQTRIVTELAARYWDARHEFHFDSPTGTIEECLARAMASGTHPVVISDSGDNPGGGGNSDQTFFLQALLKAGTKDVLLGGMTDRPATDACYRAGVGATLPLSIGATLDPLMCRPVHVKKAVVKHLTAVTRPEDGEAVVEFDGITATLSARRRLYHSAESFRDIGVDPAQFKIVVLKCGYLHPTMKVLANPALMALSPGAINQDILHIGNHRRRPTWPWVADLAWTPEPYVSARFRRG
ncbi:M81 family metallopeptidase [Acetobacter malorum]|uniref:M81 family metallopeptidase n=1 Tax=Acetobacter malorum TaxID=178901 RepID=UPI000777F520|nr:M81 family metallopeptidase [Acetobacter malorum]